MGRKVIEMPKDLVTFLTFAWFLGSMDSLLVPIFYAFLFYFQTFGPFSPLYSILWELKNCAPLLFLVLDPQPSFQMLL
jgi:hypothetical protein